MAFGDESTQLTASYLGDALGDLLGALRLIQGGVTDSRASWEEEPGEYRWVFVRRNDLVDTTILWFDDRAGTKLDRDGEVRLAGTTTVETLIAAITRGARRALEHHGESGYEELWGRFPFPIQTLRALETHS